VFYDHLYTEAHGLRKAILDLVALRRRRGLSCRSTVGGFFFFFFFFFSAAVAVCSLVSSCRRLCRGNPDRIKQPTDRQDNHSPPRSNPWTD